MTHSINLNILNLNGQILSMVVHEGVEGRTEWETP